jgi:hypothetical protein
LLLALALGVLVAATLAALIRGLLAGGEGQAARFQGPVAARAAMRDLSRDIACAFAPPIENLAPLTLKPVSDDGKSGVELSFFVSTVMADSFMGLGYDIEQVTYRLARGVDGRSEILRISAPCSGPATNAPVTNRLLAGRFDLPFRLAAENRREGRIARLPAPGTCPARRKPDPGRSSCAGRHRNPQPGGTAHGSSRRKLIVTSWSFFTLRFGWLGRRFTPL